MNQVKYQTNYYHVNLLRKTSRPIFPTLPPQEFKDENANLSDYWIANAWSDYITKHGGYTASYAANRASNNKHEEVAENPNAKKEEVVFTPVVTQPEAVEAATVETKEEIVPPPDAQLEPTTECDKECSEECKDSEVCYTKLERPELRKYAKNIGIKLGGNVSNDKIIEKIEAKLAEEKSL